MDLLTKIPEHVAGGIATRGVIRVAGAMKDAGKAFFETLFQRLRGADPIVRMTALSGGEKRKEAIRRHSDRGRRIVAGHEMIADQLEEAEPLTGERKLKKYHDVTVMGDLVRAECGGDPKFAFIDAMVAHNMCAAYAKLRQFDSARDLNAQVLDHPGATPELRALATQEKGMIEFEQHCRFAPRMSEDVRKHCQEAEELFTRAGSRLAGSPSPGVAMLHLANLLEELGERSWADELVDKASQLLAQVNDKSQLDYLKGKNVSEYFPCLSRRPNVLRSKLPWLFPLVALLLGSVPADRVTPPRLDAQSVERCSAPAPTGGEYGTELLRSDVPLLILREAQLAEHSAVRFTEPFLNDVAVDALLCEHSGVRARHNNQLT